MSRIHNVQAIKAESFPYYYFDANIWITALLPSGIPRNNALPYRKFFTDVITAGTPKPITKQRKDILEPKIVLTSLLISEIFNTYLRIFFEVYRDKRDTSCTNFKRQYRNTSDYEIRIKNLITDFSAYQDYTIMEHDYIHEIEPYTLFQEVSIKNDFNDVYSYFQMLEIRKNREQIHIVTDDADFVFNDIDVITANKALLALNRR